MASDRVAVERARELALPSLWAERHRLMNGKPYSFEGREFLRGVHDAAEHRQVIRKGNQIGGSEAVLNIAFCDVDAGIPTMYVLPTERVRDRHVSARVNPIIESSPYIRAMFDRGDNVRIKVAGETPLYFEGSNSKAGAHSVPVGSLVIDEIDRCLPSCLPEFEKRLSGQRAARVRSISTPTYPGRGIDALFDRSDARFWMVRCECGHRGTMDFDEDAPKGFPELVAVVRWDGWPETRWPTPERLEAAARSAVLVCVRCGRKWSDAERVSSIARGEWVKLWPDRETAGFHVPQVLSPVRTVPALVGDWFHALTDEDAGIPNSVRTFMNGVRGLPYLAESERIDRAHVERLVGSVVPAKDAVVCAGIDVGAKKHVCIGTKTAQMVTWEFIELDTFDEVLSLLSHRRVESAVWDAFPEKESVEKICETGEGVSYRAFVPTDQLQPAHWDDANRIVRISRVSMVSKILSRIKAQAAAIHRNRWSEKAAGHLTRVVVVDQVSATGDPVRRVVKLSAEDHFFWSAVYLEVALLRVADAVGTIDVGREPDAVADSMAAVGGFPVRLDESCGVRDLGSDNAFEAVFDESGFSSW